MIRHYPEKTVGGITGWNWLESDTGAWDGPKRDWETSHYQTILNTCRKFDRVIQAGGNQGMYPRLLSRMFGVVYTFEPDHDNFKTLVTNCDQDNIIKFQAALGNHQGMCKVNKWYDTNTGMHTITENVGTIPVIALDEFPIEKVDLIMLDLEGHEEQAILGMIDLIDNNSPVIFCENANSEIIELLSMFNYEIHSTSVMDTVFVRGGHHGR